jgi:hypothetical protein
MDEILLLQSLQSVVFKEVCTSMPFYGALILEIQRAIHIPKS